MKNDLTSKEWKTLARRLEDILWEPNEEEEKVLDAAIAKFIKVGKDIRL